MRYQLFKRICKSECVRRTVKLCAGDVLIMDNYRMLHGRVQAQAGSTARKMRRVWVECEPGVEMHRVEGEPAQHRALLRYQPYVPLGPSLRKGASIKCGIRSSSSDQGR